MPNYCENQLTITAEKTTIDTLQAAFEQGKLLEALRPEPTHEGYAPNGQPCENGMPEWWNWRIANWGTKWDVGGKDTSFERISDTEITMYFDSAWSPPVAALQSRDDIEYKLYYCEFGMGFCGEAEGSHECHTQETYDIGDEPAHITEIFRIDAMMQDDEEE